MKKPAFTLVELIAVMSAMAVVMGVAGILLVQLFAYQRDNDEYSDGIRAADRFVAAFRDDVHACGKPEIFADGETLLRWNNGTETIDYVAQSGAFPDQQAVVRTVRKDGKKTGGETYRLPDHSTLWFVDGKDANAGLVALSLWITPKGTNMPKRDEMNPFDRTIPNSPVDPQFAGNWRTIIARYNSERVKE